MIMNKEKIFECPTRRLRNVCESLISTFRRASKSDIRIIGVVPRETLKIISNDFPFYSIVFM